LYGFNVAIAVSNPPPQTETFGTPVNTLSFAGFAIAVMTPFVNVHVVVVYPVPLNTIVGAEEKFPIQPSLVIVNDVIACPVIVAVIFTAGPVPVARPPARQDPNNDLDDESPMDQDEHLDYADQGPLPFPTSTGELGPMDQFLLEMPDFMEGIKKSLQRALDSLPVPTPSPPQAGISIYEAIQVSSVNSTFPLKSYLISYLISYNIVYYIVSDMFQYRV
jgi:hypothetical protein